MTISIILFNFHKGIRELVYVTNSRNYPAQFKWILSNSGGGEPTYYINPPTGILPCKYL